MVKGKAVKTLKRRVAFGIAHLHTFAYAQFKIALTDLKHISCAPKSVSQLEYQHCIVSFFVKGREVS